MISLTEETVNAVVTKLLTLVDRDQQGDLFVQRLLNLKSQLLTKGECKAGDFRTLEEVVQLFELNYSRVVSPAAIEAHAWKIEEVIFDFPLTPSFGNLFITFLQPPCIILMNCLATVSLVNNYSKNFDRSSKAACKTALDFILNECLTVLVSWTLLVGDISL